MLTRGESYILQVSNREIGTVRGMHMSRSLKSSPKLVSVLQGKIFDVCIDVRPDSKTLGRVFSGDLSSSAGDVLIVPPGFLHGYQVLESNTVLVYALEDRDPDFLTQRFCPVDSSIGSLWPMIPTNVSELDKNATTLGFSLTSSLPFELD